LIAKPLRRFFHGEGGPTAVEYSIILALVLVASIMSIRMVGCSTTWSFIRSNAAVATTTD